ncbi:MAG: hypothetical protein WDN04_06005 [Rhodospirillales bacterium]
MPGSMHAILARVYHLSLRILLAPLWRPPVASVATALLLRLLGAPRAGMAACLAVLAGWLALVLPAAPLWPATPLSRLPGAALLLLGFTLVAPRASRRWAWATLPLYALLQSCWLRGAPLTGAGVANTVPVFLGLLAAAALVRRLAARDAGWTSIAAAAGLSVSLYLSGGAAHWARAALVPACAGAALLGLPLSVAPLAQAVVVVTVAAIVASDRGRFIPVDAAAAAPLLVWWLAPRLLPRLNRAGPALAGALAATAGVACAAGVAYLLTQR